MTQPREDFWGRTVTPLDSTWDTRPAEVVFCERWKPVPEADGRFEVSDQGRLKRVYRASGSGPLGLVEPSVNPEGYCFLHTRVRYRCVRRSVQRLVMEAFVGPRPKGMQIAHLNGNPADNRLANLAYVTPAENTAHKWGHGTMRRPSYKGHARKTILSDGDVRAIRSSQDSIATLSRRHGVHTRHISAIRARDARASVPDAHCDLCGRAHPANPDVEAVTGLWACSACIEHTLEGACV